MIWLLIFVMLAAVFMIPFGLPGLWIMTVVVLAGWLMGEVGMLVLAVTVVLALVAELIEFLIVKRLTEQYGGSRKAFWGAIGGGLIGVIVGAPVPVVGSILAALVGTFIGAALVT